jgi:hypothetical protein
MVENRTLRGIQMEGILRSIPKNVGFKGIPMYSCISGIE